MNDETMMDATSATNRAPSMLQHRLFYAKKCTSVGGNGEHNSSASSEHSVLMIFDSPTYLNDPDGMNPRNEAAAAGGGGNGNENLAEDDDDDGDDNAPEMPVDPAQEALAMERTMEALSRRTMDQFVGQAMNEGGLGAGRPRGHVTIRQVRGGALPPGLARAMAAAAGGGGGQAGAAARPNPAPENANAVGDAARPNPAPENANAAAPEADAAAAAGNEGNASANQNQVPNGNNNNHNPNGENHNQNQPRRPAQPRGIGAAIAAAMRRALGWNNNNDNNNNNNAENNNGNATNNDNGNATNNGNAANVNRPQERPHRRHDQNEAQQQGRRQRQRVGEPLQQQPQQPQAVRGGGGPAAVMQIMMAQGPDGRLIPVPMQRHQGQRQPQQQQPEEGAANQENPAAAGGLGIAQAIGDAIQQAMQQANLEDGNVDDNQNNNNENNNNNNNQNQDQQENPAMVANNVGAAVEQAILRALQGGGQPPNNGNGNGDGDNNGNNNPNVNGNANNNNNVPFGIPIPFGAFPAAINVDMNMNVVNRNDDNNNNNNNNDAVNNNNNNNNDNNAGEDNNAGNNNNNNNDGNNPMPGGIPGGMFAFGGNEPAAFAFQGGHGRAQFGFGAIPVPFMDMSSVRKPKWSLNKLERVLNRRFQNTQALRLDALEGSWDVLSNDDWNEVCERLALALPNVKEIHIRNAEHLNDQKWASLLKRFPRITSLKISHLGDMPETCEQIGQLLSLQELSLRDESTARTSGIGLSGYACKVLAKSLRRLPVLAKLTVQNLLVKEPGGMTILIKAIRGIPTLAQLEINGGWYHRSTNNMIGGPQISSRINLSTNNLQKLQYGPRICAAKKLYLHMAEPALSDWVKALIAVRDRIDCLHYLLAEMDPNMFAVPALEAAILNEQQQQNAPADVVVAA